MGATAIDHVGVFVVAVVDACMSFWCVVVAVWVFLVCVCVFFCVGVCVWWEFFCSKGTSGFIFPVSNHSV